MEERPQETRSTEGRREELVEDTSCTECDCSGWLDPQKADECVNFRGGTLFRCGHNRKQHRSG